MPQQGALHPGICVLPALCHGLLAPTLRRCCLYLLAQEESCVRGACGDARGGGVEEARSGSAETARGLGLGARAVID